MGVEYPGEMDFYLWLAGPDIGLVTNINPTHLISFGNTDGVFKEKQKLYLARALYKTESKILFLDEPTNGVDPVSRRDFWKILYELHREGVTILVASTYLDEADRCHRVAFFDRGTVRLVMDPLSLRNLVRGQLFDLKTPDRRKAMRILKTTPGVTQASLFGAGIHFSLKEAEDLPPVEKELTSSGLGAFHLEPIQPSLEDVYLSLVEGNRDPCVTRQ